MFVAFISEWLASTLLEFFYLFTFVETRRITFVNTICDLVNFTGLFIGDAVSMPVHWYYNALLIKDDFNGWITKYEQPKNIHPGTSGLTRPNPSEFAAGCLTSFAFIVQDLVYIRIKFKTVQAL